MHQEKQDKITEYINKLKILKKNEEESHNSIKEITPKIRFYSELIEKSSGPEDYVEEGISEKILFYKLVYYNWVKQQKERFLQEKIIYSSLIEELNLEEYELDVRERIHKNLKNLLDMTNEQLLFFNDKIPELENLLLEETNMELNQTLN